MIIAVTGASGHLGQWIVARLTAEGNEVLAISRHPLERPQIAGLTWPRPVEPVVCDLGDSSSVAACAAELRRAEAVVHLAAHVPADTAQNTDEDARRTFTANVLGTMHLLAALGAGAAVRCVVYASTFEVYGAPRPGPIDEEHPTVPLGYYGASKLAGEKVLALFAAERGIPCSSLRLPAIYGPGDTLRRAIGNFIRAAAKGEELVVQGDGSDRRELVYAGDAADAVDAAIRVGAEGPFNIASGEGYSIRAMADAALEAAGGSARITCRPRVKPHLDYVLDTTRAARVLGWRPRTPLAEGVRAQLEWVRRGNASS